MNEPLPPLPARTNLFIERSAVVRSAMASVDRPVPPSASSDGREIAMARARDAIARGQAEEAIEVLRASIPLHPSDPEVRLALVEALERADRPAEALRAADELLGLDPRSLPAWRAKAGIYRRAGDVEGLLAALRSIAELDPSDRISRLEQYHMLDLRGESEEAYRVLQEVTTGGDSPLPELSISSLWLAQAELALSLGRIEDADLAFQRAAEDPARAAPAALGRARAARADGRPDLALERLRPLVEGNANAEAVPAEVRQIYAELLCAAERIPEARAVYDAWRTADPTSAPALAGAARTRLEEGRHPEARELLRSGIDHVPWTEELVLAWAEAESGSGDLTAAERVVREGLERFPQGVRLYSRLAEIGVARGDWPGAEAAYRHALTIRARDVELLLGLAFVQEKRGDRSGALAGFREAATVAPNDLRIWTRQGSLLLADGRPDEARACFEKALAIDPESDAARDGKRVAEREHRTVAIDGHALAALREEARIGRPITKNDLFVTLHVPFDLLDAVLAAIAREVSVDVPALPPEELDRFERESNLLIGRALESGRIAADGGEIDLAVVAALADPEDRLLVVQRRFAYVRAVLGMEIRPENLHLTPEVEAVARDALSLPPAERGLFALVHALGIGIFRARIVKAVERASATPRPALPSVEHSDAPDGGHPADGRPLDSGRFFPPPTRALDLSHPLPPALEAARAPVVRVPRGWPKGVEPLTSSARTRADGPASVRCIGCGGLATVQHSCGGPLCPLCAHQFGNCPKCGEPIGPRPTVSPPASSRPARHLLAGARNPPPRSLRPVAGPPRGPSPRGAPLPRDAPKPAGTERSVPRTNPGPTTSKTGAVKIPPKAPVSPPAPDRKGEPASPGKRGGDAVPAPAAPAPAPPRPRREKVDDEPRL